MCDGVESSAVDEVADGDVPGVLFLLGSGEFPALSGAGDGGFGDAGEFGCFGDGEELVEVVVHVCNGSGVVRCTRRTTLLHVVQCGGALGGAVGCFGV